MMAASMTVEHGTWQELRYNITEVMTNQVGTYIQMSVTLDKRQSNLTISINLNGKTDKQSKPIL